MGAIFAQAARMGRLATVLGQDVLVLQRFTGHESLSASFVWQVDCLAATPDIDFDALIGTHATVTLVTLSGDRSFDGIVTEAQWLGAGENGIRYRLVLKPWFHLARLRRNQRIFHNKTVVQILTELLGAYAATGKMQPSLTADYPVLEYTVQFRESDHDFACRLMERFGITYHFQHVAGDHTMVLTDASASHASIGARPFHPVDGHHQADGTHFWDWRPARRMTTGAIRLTDYNFKTPNAAMEVDQTGDASYAEGQIESFDWPGDYLDQGRGRVVARLRTTAERGQDRRYEAVGDVAELGAGMRVTLGGDAVPGTGGDYLCLTATHSYTSDSYGSGAAEGDGYAYSGRYLLLPATAPMLPELKTPRADVKGPQTAVVVGEGEIDCDEYGRILVRFHWDLAAAHSMRCRVSQSWAGNGWGGMVIPRIGMEVVVEFLDGDPDQPLVTGCVYNGRQARPYELPAHKTKSVLRSDSHKSSGHNEISFEDATGAEVMFFHAQKDMTTHVLNNRAARVDRSSVDSVGKNKLVSTGKNHQETIGGSMNRTVGGGLGGLFGALGAVAAAGGQDALAGSEAVGNKAISGFVASLAAAGAAVEMAAGSARAGFDGAGNHTRVGGAEQASHAMGIAGLLSSVMPLSGVMTTVVEKFRSDTIGLARTEQIGAYKNTSVGHTMTVHVGKEFIINVGKSKFVMDSDGNVTIIGTKFNFSASGNVQINGKVIDLN
jgi:type VI secretion system secreted protein VgrG